MPTIVWTEIPHPYTLTMGGWGVDPWSTTPWGSPTTTVSGMGNIDWVEITNATVGE